MGEDISDKVTQFAEKVIETGTSKEKWLLQSELARERLDLHSWKINLEAKIIELEARVEFARQKITEQKEEVANLELQVAMRTRKINQLSKELWKGLES